MLSCLMRLSALAAGLAIAMPAFAQQPPSPVQGQAAQPQPTASHLAAARAVIEVTGVMTNVDEILPGLMDDIRKQNLTRPELTKDLEDVLKKLQPELQLQKQQVTDVVTRAYAKYLTEDELKSVAAFFKTPAGAKYLKVQPELIDEVVNDIQTWGQQASEYVMVRTRAEMAKKGQQMQ